jgi:hypothetical protein
MAKTHEWSPTSRGKTLGLRADRRNSLQDIIKRQSPPFMTSTNMEPVSLSLVLDVPRSYQCDIRRIIRYICTCNVSGRIQCRDKIWGRKVIIIPSLYSRVSIFPSRSQVEAFNYYARSRIMLVSFIIMLVPL